MKNKKLLIAVVAAVVILAGAAGFYLLTGSDGTSGGTKNVVKLNDGGFPASVKDASVYEIIEKFLDAQVKNERQAVMELLSTEHRAVWKEDSFLVAKVAFDNFDDVKIDNLKMGVIDFQSVNGKNLASVYINYSVLFMKNDAVVTGANVVEELGLSNQDDKWFIDRNLRSVVAAKE